MTCDKSKCQNKAIVEGYLGPLKVYSCFEHIGEVEMITKIINKEEYNRCVISVANTK